MFRARDWLARLSFSFFIVGLVLAWEAYRGFEGLMSVATWQLVLYMVGAASAFALGFLGVRARHHPED